MGRMLLNLYWIISIHNDDIVSPCGYKVTRNSEGGFGEVGYMFFIWGL